MQVKVIILQSAQGPGRSYTAGEERTVSIQKAQHWQKSGFARIVEYIKETKETAVNPKVETAQRTVKLATKDVSDKLVAKKRGRRKRVTKD